MVRGEGSRGVGRDEQGVRRGASIEIRRGGEERCLNRDPARCLNREISPEEVREDREPVAGSRFSRTPHREGGRLSPQGGRLSPQGGREGGREGGEVGGRWGGGGGVGRGGGRGRRGRREVGRGGEEE